MTVKISKIHSNGISTVSILLPLLAILTVVNNANAAPLISSSSSSSVLTLFKRYRGEDDNEEVDQHMLVISIVFMFILYVLVVVIFLVIRFTVQRTLYRNGRLSLLNDEERLNRERRNVSIPRHRHHSLSLNAPGFINNIRRKKTNNKKDKLNKKKDPSLIWPNILDDELEIKDKLSKLTPEEQFFYKQGEEFIRTNSPLIIPQELSLGNTSTNPDGIVVDPIINEQTKNFIKEEGANAWEFKADPNLPNDTILIENKTELTFLNFNYDASVMTNLPIPRINRVYYCEFKIFELDENEINNSNIDPNKQIISLGLATNPYPHFRLPGRHHHSISYDMTGARRFNDSFELEPQLATIFPRFSKGDIIGIGYRSNSGTVFFTRNGKKLNEKPIGGHIKNWRFKYLYPIVGSNIPCKIHVNFGTVGFIFIEANVKKWGYGKTHGKKLPPPSYDDYNKDTLLENAINEDENDDDTLESNDSDSDSISSVTNQYNASQPYTIQKSYKGEIFPPPPGFEYASSPIGMSNKEQFKLQPMPNEPPSYSDDEVFLNKAIDEKDNHNAIVGRSKDIINDEIPNDIQQQYNDDKANDDENNALNYSDYERTTSRGNDVDAHEINNHDDYEDDDDFSDDDFTNELQGLLQNSNSARSDSK